MAMRYLSGTVLILFSLLMASCSSKPSAPQPMSYRDLDADKAVEKVRDESERKRMDKVSALGMSGYGGRHIMVAFLDGDKIVYISDKRIDCTDGYECVWFGLSGYDVDFDINREYQCGYYTFGLAGDDQHYSGCQSSFTSVDNYLFEAVARVWYGILTWGVAPVIAGNLHTRKFDLEYFQGRVVDSDLDIVRQQLMEIPLAERAFAGSQDVTSYIDETVKPALGGGGAGGTYEVVYVDAYDVEADPDTERTDYDGVIFLDADKGTIYGVYNYADFKSRNYSRAINRIITDLYGNIAKDKNIFLTADTVRSMIPPEVPQPNIPPPERLVKSEYEKQADFEARVRQAATDREAMIKNLQKDYDEKVAARNRFIVELEQKYQDGLKGQKERPQKVIESINDNLEDLSKFLFVRYMGGFKATDMRYDAEHENLYFTLLSNNGTYKNMVMANVPPDDARVIKEQGKYAITPKLDYNKQTLYVEGFEIEEGEGGSDYDVVYTNKSFEPTQVAVSIANENERIAANEQVNFSQYKQKPTDLIAYDKREVWSIDVVSRADAKVPKWFETLQTSSERLYGFGIGASLEEAYDIARANLARNMQSDISVASSLKQESTSNSQQYSRYDKQVGVSTKAQLQKGDYREYKKEKLDGMWYVALEYTGGAHGSYDVARSNLTTKDGR